MKTERRQFLRYLAGITAGGVLGGCATLKPSERLNFVLVHASWHGAWCWDKVVPLLRSAGHQVTATDLPGHGADRTPADQIRLATYVQHVVGLLDAQGGPVILVGHSSSGLVVSQVAEERPDRIRTLVFLSAFLVADGEAWRGGQDPGSKVGPLFRMEFRPGTKIPLQSRIDVSNPDAVKLAFYNDCEENDARAAIARLVPEPAAPMVEKLRLSADRFGRVDKVYILCSRDNAVSPPMQRNYIAKWPMRKVITLDSGHSPFLSMPARLSEVLTSGLGDSASAS